MDFPPPSTGAGRRQSSPRAQAFLGQAKPTQGLPTVVGPPTLGVCPRLVSDRIGGGGPLRVAV